MLFLLSCSTKTKNNDIQADLTSTLAQTNQNITVKTDYNKVLKETAKIILDEYKNGKFGKVSLEQPDKL